MFARQLILSLSLVGNIALAVAFLGSPEKPQPLAGPHRPEARASEAAPAANAATETVATDPSTTTGVRPAPFAWAEIETDNPVKLAERLVAAGYSSADALAVVLAHRAGRIEASSSSSTAEYWRSMRTDIADPKVAAEQRRQMLEQSRLLSRLLNGPLSFDDPDRVESARRQWGDLPVEKLRAIAAIEVDYRELMTRQFVERRDRPGDERPDDAAIFRTIEQERMADIAKVLTPEELADFELRGSRMAMSLRQGLETFRPNEAEYRAIYALLKPYDDRLFDASPAARKALNGEVLERIREVLGPERAADYDAAMNHNSMDQTAQLVARLNLPARVAVEVRQAQSDFTNRATSIRADTTLSSADRNARLAALAREAEAQIATKLGPDGFEAYNDLKGEWIRAIKPKPGG